MAVAVDVESQFYCSCAKLVLCGVRRSAWGVDYLQASVHPCRPSFSPAPSLPGSSTCKLGLPTHPFVALKGACGDGCQKLPSDGYHKGCGCGCDFEWTAGCQYMRPRTAAATNPDIAHPRCCGTAKPVDGMAKAARRLREGYTGRNVRRNQLCTHARGRAGASMVSRAYPSCA